MWGIIPAAGAGSRIQPLAFSKELLPVGSRFDGESERPRAVSEYLVERMILGGARRICFVISPGKSDILEYYGGSVPGAEICYTVQPRPAGLCDSIFRAWPLVGRDDPVLVGLPDTIWFPENALGTLPGDALSFLLFSVNRPELFDAVLTGEGGEVREVQVKSAEARERIGSGAPSGCQAKSFTNSTNSGLRASRAMSISERWSTPGSNGAAAPWVYAPGSPTWTWVR